MRGRRELGRWRTLVGPGPAAYIPQPSPTAGEGGGARGLWATAGGGPTNGGTRYWLPGMACRIHAPKATDQACAPSASI